jgi:hypothetical protein
MNHDRLRLLSANDASCYFRRRIQSFGAIHEARSNGWIVPDFRHHSRIAREVPGPISHPNHWLTFINQRTRPPVAMPEAP